MGSGLDEGTLLTMLAVLDSEQSEVRRILRNGPLKPETRAHFDERMRRLTMAIAWVRSEREATTPND